MRYQVGTAVGGPCTERTAWMSCRIRRRGATLLIALAVVEGISSACGDGERAEGRQPRTAAGGSATRVAGSAGSTGTARAPQKPICPATGAWQLCSVVERLERAGLAPRQQPGRVLEPPLSSPGVTILLGRSELRIFMYTDRAARERDQAKLNSSKYLSASEPLSMQAEPTLIASENLLAILRSRSDHQRERVSDALMAGPPQRPGTKG
jgi:hypothetical protein